MAPHQHRSTPLISEEPENDRFLSAHPPSTDSRPGDDGDPGSALAAPPEVVVDETFSDTFINGDASAACGFEVWVTDTDSAKVTLFFNKDGSVNHEGVHVRGSTEWTGPSGATAWKHWAWSGKFFPETATFTQSGNVYNVHAGAGGVLVNDKGEIVFSPDGVT